MALKRKTLSLIVVASLSALIVTSTLAWTSLNSQKLNEWRGSGTNPGNSPGGTLHDDHNESESNKDVYVENWGNEDIFARIRLDEYMELGPGAGLKSVTANQPGEEIIHNPNNHAKPLVDGADIDNTDTWETHVPKVSEPSKCESSADFHNYWKWDMGGQKYYYPVSESNRESNGYVDSNSPDNLTEDSVNSAGVPAKLTNDAQVLTMSEWKDINSPIGNYWVIDTDGWAYWAAPIKPGESTGLLMNRVTLNENNKPNKDYYYGINVIAQMATKDGTAADGSLDNYKSFGNFGWTPDGSALMDSIVMSSDIGNSVLSSTPGVIMTPTLAPSASATPTVALAVSTTPTASSTPAASASPAITATTTPTTTSTPAATMTPTVAFTPSVTMTPTVTSTPAVTMTPTATEAPTVTSTPTATMTPTVTSTPTATLTPTVTFTPSATMTPTATETPTPKATAAPIVPSVTIAPGITPPTMTVSKGTVIDNIIYTKTKQVIEFTAKGNATFTAGLLDINGAAIGMGDAVTPYYTITDPANNDYLKATIVINDIVPVGSEIPIIATIFTPEIVTNHVDPRHYIDNSKTIKVIPSDCSSASKGSNGNIYLKYSNNVYREFYDDGSLGPEISKLP